MNEREKIIISPKDGMIYWEMPNRSFDNITQLTMA